MAFGLTEPGHGSDVTWLETRAVRDGDWVITGAKRWNSVVDVSEVDLVFARTSGEDGKADGISAFLVPKDAPGFESRSTGDVQHADRPRRGTPGRWTSKARLL